MRKIPFTIAASAVALGLAGCTGGAFRQEVRDFGQGPMAAIPGAMTQAQARRACMTELRGNTNRRVPRATLEICMRNKMFGTGKRDEFD